MNQSSLFSFEESSVWDPKVIRKCLVVSADQLIKLDSIPGWVKVKDNQDTLRLEKDFSIESSQSDCPVNVVQNSQRIEKNRELFNEQIENRKAILEVYKVYENKLARSLSLFTISESCKNLLNDKTLKQASSFQNLYQLSDTSNINNHLIDSRCEHFSERQFSPDTCNRNILSNKPIGNINLSSECKTSRPESGESAELFLSKEIDSKTMEIVSQLPATIPNPIENASMHFETVKESNDILLTENPPTALSKQLIKDVIKSVGAEIAFGNPLHYEVFGGNNGVVPVENTAAGSDQFVELKAESVNADLAKESNSTIPTVNLALCSNDVSDDPAKTVNSDISSLNKFNESCIPVSTENVKPDSSIVKEVPCNVISAGEVSPCPKNVFDEFVTSMVSSSIKSGESDPISVKDVPANVVSVSENPTLHLNAQDQEKILPYNLRNANKIISDSDMISVENIALKNDAMISAKSDDLNVHESCPSKSQAIASPVKAFDISKKETILETEKLVKNCGFDMKEMKLENEQKEVDNKACKPMKSSADNEASSGDNDVSFSKKRKLESRNKRSKRVKSDDKQSNIKIRSIKKVGEICYSVEEVKTMLNIMKQLL